MSKLHATFFIAIGMSIGLSVLGVAQLLEAPFPTSWQIALVVQGIIVGWVGVRALAFTPSFSDPIRDSEKRGANKAHPKKNRVYSTQETENTAKRFGCIGGCQGVNEETHNPQEKGEHTASESTE